MNRLARSLSLATVASGLLVSLGMLTPLSGCTGTRSAPTLRLQPGNAPGGTGVVRRTDLLIAYTRSPAHDTPIDDLRRRRDEAAAAGDTTTVDGLNAYGAEWQEIAHRQLAGTEPIYTVLLAVQDELRAVMDARGLDRVVEAGRGVEGIDITDDLIARLPVAERYR